MAVIVERNYEDYTDLLPIQYNDSDNLREFLRIYLEKVEDLNVSQLELSEINTDFKTATGYQLDLIGKLVGALRQGRSDSDYRNYILFKISINIGSGTPEDVINYLSIATDATRIRYFEHYPACTVLETNGTNIPSAIPSTLDNVTPAGVRTGGIMVLIDDYGFRPVELSTAYDNQYTYVPNATIDDVDFGSVDAEMGGSLIECAKGADFSGLALGQSGAELGTMELQSFDGDKVFALVGVEFLLGQGIYPELSDIYETGYSLAGDEKMLAGDEEALAAGLFVKEGAGNRGKRAELLTDRNQSSF